MNKYQPLSINPEQLQNTSSLMSPVNFLSKTPSPIKAQLQKENSDLRQNIQKLMMELNFRRQKNQSLRTEVHKQQKKMTSWKSCYQKAEQEYIMKKQFIEVLEQKLKSLKQKNEQNCCEAPRRMAMQDQQMSEELKENNENEDSFKLSKKLCREDRGMSYLPKMNRVSSIALERRKSKKKQALSLTHLHRYWRQNY